MTRYKVLTFTCSANFLQLSHYTESGTDAISAKIEQDLDECSADGWALDKMTTETILGVLVHTLILTKIDDSFGH